MIPFLRYLGMSIACLTGVAPSAAQTGAAGGEWRHYGGDAGSTKYSPLDQIDRDNVGELRIAWTWDSPDLPIMASQRTLRSWQFEPTPLAVGGVLYTATSLSQVAAIDARTGQTLWTYDPESYRGPRPTNLGYLHRGVVYWTDGEVERVFIPTVDAWLIALDAKTGEPAEEFGEGGRVDLIAGIPRAVRKSNYIVNSPPVICRGVIVVGASINDGPRMKEAPPGHVRGFDARTGELKWTFHSVAQEGEFGVETWEEDSWRYSGNTNVWTLMSADEELGYVYLPFGTPTNDWYGGHRKGDNLFAESLVCLDAATGERVWHFQTTHHGVWDYDLPAAPVLCNITVEGRAIAAVAQITKQGFCFVFDRATGEPVWPIEERAAPPSAVPGERLSPTQPFPTKPPAYETQGATEANLIDFTPALRAAALEILNQYEHGPLYTPPSERGTINLPGWGGGANWWGAAFDPETGMFYIPSTTGPIVVRLVQPDPARSNLRYIRGGGLLQGGLGGPQGLPLFKPPYGRITALDLNAGDLAWQIPHGDGPRAAVSAIAGRDVGPLGAGGGGPLLTKTLLFVGQGGRARGAGAETQRPVLRAFDKATGEVLHAIELPGNPTATPMTYAIDGKQFIVVGISGEKFVALTLP